MWSVLNNIHQQILTQFDVLRAYVYGTINRTAQQHQQYVVLQIF